VKVITGSEYEADFLIGMLGDGVQKKRVGKIEYKVFRALTNKQRNDKYKANKIKKGY
jgi:hypothetical protein